MNNLFQGFLNAIKAKFVPMWTKIRLLTNPTYLKNEVLRRLIVYFRSLTDVRPKDKHDYYGIFGWLISKRLAFFIVAFIGGFIILKIPTTTSSSIVILEGNYTNFTRTNKTIINLESEVAIEWLSDKLITPLQLLRLNTGESYPFADRLLEYLLGNTITLNEEIEDNIIRLKTVVDSRCPEEFIDYSNGIWEPKLQALIYNYINRHADTHDINHDILGFVDKDVEKLYSTNDETLLNIDIYNKKER